jgi:molecular chaperone HtpG
LKEKAKQDKAKNKIIDKITKNIKDELPDNVAIPENNKGMPKLLTDNLSRHSRSERKLISRILSIIDNVLPKDLSESVKQKIIEELNK